MKRGFCYIAEHSEPRRALQRIIRTLGSIGIQSANPGNGRITHLVGDGEALDVTKADLVQAVAVRPELTPQFWTSPDTYVASNFRRLDAGIVRHAYSLDGLDADERAGLVKWAVDYFREAVSEGTALLLVVDPPGRTADVDWDSVVIQNVGLPSVLPAVIGLPASWVRHLTIPRAYSREALGDHELLTLQPGVE